MTRETRTDADQASDWSVMMHRWPVLRAYMWQEWLMAFSNPEVIANGDASNFWAKMEASKRRVEISEAERLLFGDIVQKFLPKQQFSPIVLEGQRRTEE